MTIHQQHRHPATDGAGRRQGCDGVDITQQQLANHQHFRHQHEDQRQPAVGAQPAVAHDLQHPIAGAGGEDAVAGISQPVKVKSAGEQRQRQHAEQRRQRDAAPRLQEERHCAGDGAEQ